MSQDDPARPKRANSSQPEPSIWPDSAARPDSSAHPGPQLRPDSQLRPDPSAPEHLTPKRPDPIRPADVQDLAAGLASEDATRLGEPRPVRRRDVAGPPSNAQDLANGGEPDPRSAIPTVPPPGGSSSGSTGTGSWHSSLRSGRSGSGIGRSGYRYSRPVDRYQIPVEETAAQQRKISPRTLLGGLVGLIIFGMLAGFIYVRFLRDISAPDDTIVQPSVSASDGPRLSAPEEVVRQYLNALAKGDVTTAISLGPRSPGETVAITPEAYKASLATHPITDISVPRQDNVSSFVAASYKLGGQTIDTRFRVVLDDAGGWRLARSTIEFKFNYRESDRLRMRLNGKTLEGTTAALLPGSYTVDTGVPYISFGNDIKVVVSNLEYEGSVQRTLTPALTDAGSQALIAAGRSSLQACMNSGTLNPEGCPNQMTAAAPYQPASVRWTLLDDPFANTSAALNINRPTWGQASVLLRFEVSFTYEDGTTSGRQRPTPITASFSADMLVSESGALHVTWTS